MAQSPYFTSCKNTITTIHWLKQINRKVKAIKDIENNAEILDNLMKNQDIMPFILSLITDKREEIMAKIDDKIENGVGLNSEELSEFIKNTLLDNCPPLISRIEWEEEKNEKNEEIKKLKEKNINLKHEKNEEIKKLNEENINLEYEKNEEIKKLKEKNINLEYEKNEEIKKLKEKNINLEHEKNEEIKKLKGRNITLQTEKPQLKKIQMVKNTNSKKEGPEKEERVKQPTNDAKKRSEKVTTGNIVESDQKTPQKNKKRKPRRALTPTVNTPKTTKTSSTFFNSPIRTDSDRVKDNVCNAFKEGDCYKKNKKYKKARHCYELGLKSIRKLENKGTISDELKQDKTKLIGYIGYINEIETPKAPKSNIVQKKK